jgi:hypothetical protein
MACSSVLGLVLMGLGKSLSVTLALSSGLIVWATASFFGNFFLPIINGSNQAIWQAKVAPDVQGRVFSVRRLIAQVTGPVAMLVSGPLADRFFEPAMAQGGLLANGFGGLVGTGPGAGMALMFVLSGLLGLGIGLGGYLFPLVRNVESILSDHEAKVVPAGKMSAPTLTTADAPKTASD